MSFVEELKRRNVFRVAIAYLVIAWLVMQVGDTLRPALLLPEWVNSLLAFFLVLGFPVALFFAWAFELTPSGLKKDQELEPGESHWAANSRRLDRIIIVVLALALGYFAVDKLALDPVDQPIPAETAALSDNAASKPIDSIDEVSARSIAVLPFVNMSSDPEQEYFSDGLTEELLNLLAGIDELKVAARTSSFYYKDKRNLITLQEIAKQLAVAHLLEGSVRKSGDNIRITTQLIKADDGFHVWSKTYDRKLDDIFAIQDEIAAAVVEALKVTLLGEAPKARVVNTEAYELTLQGRYFFNRRAEGDLDRARDYFERAVKLDPDIAAAWVGLVPLYTWASDPPDVPRARAAAEKALALEPDNPEVHIRLALIHAYEGNRDAMTKEFQEALRLGPDNPLVLSVHAGGRANAGDLDGAIEYQKRAVSVDPLVTTSHNNLGGYLEWAGRLDEALAANEKAAELNPGNIDSRKAIGRIRLQKGHAQEALEIFQALPDDREKLYYLSLAHYSLGNLEASDAAMAEYEEKYSAEFPIEMAGMYAWRGELDLAFLRLDRAAETYNPGDLDYLLDPFLKNLHNDPRWDVYINKVRSAN